MHSISSFQGENGEKKLVTKTEEAGSASVSPYGSVLGYEQVTSQPSRPITVVWPEYCTWFIGPWTAWFASWESCVLCVAHTQTGRD